mmetsp:Transcript_18700/g.34435  ORF Transcript_18700/g.34435 Transcript_18700/m.34435 type:complete len:287 (-) Transcript_18700:830-1690(-)
MLIKIITIAQILRGKGGILPKLWIGKNIPLGNIKSRPINLDVERRAIILPDSHEGVSTGLLLGVSEIATEIGGIFQGCEGIDPYEIFGGLNVGMDGDLSWTMGVGIWCVCVMVIVVALSVCFGWIIVDWRLTTTTATTANMTTVIISSTILLLVVVGLVFVVIVQLEFRRGWSLLNGQDRVGNTYPPPFRVWDGWHITLILTTTTILLILVHALLMKSDTIHGNGGIANVRCAGCCRGIPFFRLAITAAFSLFQAGVKHASLFQAGVEHACGGLYVYYLVAIEFGA